MVVSAVGVKKLWKCLRTSVAASRRVIKQKLKKKKRGSGNERFDHYNFSDDDEMDSRMGKKLTAWKIKALGCVFGRAEIEPRRAQFVYVTDLYSSAPSAVMACYEADAAKAKADNNTGEENDGASGSSPAADTDMPVGVDQNRKSTSSDQLKLKAEASPSSPSRRKKTVCWAESERGLKIGMTEEVDTDAEQFISKFYEDIKLERQKSIVEYREMLDRGTTSSSS